MRTGTRGYGGMAVRLAFTPSCGAGSHPAAPHSNTSSAATSHSPTAAQTKTGAECVLSVGLPLPKKCPRKHKTDNKDLLLVLKEGYHWLDLGASQTLRFPSFSCWLFLGDTVFHD